MRENLISIIFSPISIKIDNCPRCRQHTSRLPTLGYPALLLQVILILLHNFTSSSLFTHSHFYQKSVYSFYLASSSHLSIFFLSTFLLSIFPPSVYPPIFSPPSPHFVVHHFSTEQPNQHHKISKQLYPIANVNLDIFSTPLGHHLSHFYPDAIPLITLKSRSPPLSCSPC